MRTLRSWLLRFAGLFNRQISDREFAEEVESNLQLHIDEKVRAGMPAEEARRDALIKLGGIEQVKESYRERRGVPWIESLFQDARFGLRMLGKSPTLTLIIAVTLALGIGANTAIFGIVNGAMLRPLSVRAPEQIVALAIQQKDAPLGSSGFSYPEFVDFREQAGAFSDVFGIVLGSVQVASDGESEQYFANYVSKGFFTALGVVPTAGRLFLPGDGETPGEPLTVVLGYSYWQKRFHGDPGVVGRQIEVNGKSATIVGVVPRRFQGVYSIVEMDLYLPLSSVGALEPARSPYQNRDQRLMLAFGRLKSDVSLRQAQSSLDVIASRLAAQYPATDKWYTVRAVPERLARPIPYANDAFLAISSLFLGLAVFVLLLACINVENILLAQGTARQREMAIRAALGAGRARLICQMLTESILLAVLGGVAGLILGTWVDHLAESIRMRNLPLHVDVSFDWRVFVFAAGCAMATGIVVGMVPALRGSKTDLNSVLHEGGQRTFIGLDNAAVRSFLVIAQVAGSFTLLVAAGLFARSLQIVRGFHLGFEPDHVLNVIIDPAQAGYDESRTTTFYDQVESRVRTLPGVKSASLASYVPMGGYPTKAAIFVQGRGVLSGTQPPLVAFNRIDPEYFETMGITLLRGRTFVDSDNKTSPRVAIVNQTMASTFWPGQDAIGKFFRPGSETAQPVKVVGVSSNGKYLAINEDSLPFFYIPLAQDFVSQRALQIRAFAAAESLEASVKEQVGQLAPGLSLIDIETMNQSLEEGIGYFAFRVSAICAAVLGAAGLTLAVVGVYGVVSFTVSQRTREIGIRLALGASRRDILDLIWTQGMRLVFIGVAVGTIAALSLSRTMKHVLAGVSTSDPPTYFGVAILMSVVGLIACWIPARRAMRVDPMVALRHE